MGDTCLIVSLKLITFTTFIFGGCIIITCGWTFVSVFNHEMKIQKEIEETTPPPQSSTTTYIHKNETLKPKRNPQEFESEFESSSINSTENINKFMNKNKNRFYIKFKKMDGEFRVIVLICLSVAMIAGFLQTMSSMLTLSSCSKKATNNLKIWMGLHFLVFLILLISITVPLTYHPEKGEHVKFNDFIPTLKSRWSRITVNKPIVDTLTEDLTAYYIVLGLNDVLLFIFMIALCICKVCMKPSYEPIN